MTSFKSTSSRCGVPFLNKRRLRSVISLATVPSFTIIVTAARASSRLAGSRSSQRRQASAWVTAAAIGWITS
jgi:hypothetical protein